MKSRCCRGGGLWLELIFPRVCTSNGFGTQGSVFCEWLKLIRCCYVLGDAVFCSFFGVGFLSVVGVRC